MSRFFPYFDRFESSRKAFCIALGLAVMLGSGFNSGSPSLTSVSVIRALCGGCVRSSLRVHSWWPVLWEAADELAITSADLSPQPFLVRPQHPGGGFSVSHSKEINLSVPAGNRLAACKCAEFHECLSNCPVFSKLAFPRFFPWISLCIVNFVLPGLIDISDTQWEYWLFCTQDLSCI